MSLSAGVGNKLTAKSQDSDSEIQAKVLLVSNLPNRTLTSVAEPLTATPRWF